MIKAVFLDFDGTTYSHKTKKIPDSARKAILEAQSNEVKVFLSTGRDMEEVEAFDCRGIQFDGFVLASGQLLMDKEHNILHVNYIEGEEKQKIIDLYNSGTIPVMIRSLNDGFINFIDDATTEVFKEVDSGYPLFKKYNNEDILMATIFTNKKDIKEKMMDKFKNLNITWWHEHSADLISKNSNKATGIKKILEYYNIPLEDTISIGDGHNDIEMLKQSKISIAMGNSTDEIKEMADFVTTDIDEDGLYNAFKKYNVI